MMGFFLEISVVFITNSQLFRTITVTDCQGIHSFPKGPLLYITRNNREIPMTRVPQLFSIYGDTDKAEALKSMSYYYDSYLVLYGLINKGIPEI